MSLLQPHIQPILDLVASLSHREINYEVKNYGDRSLQVLLTYPRSESLSPAMTLALVGVRVSIVQDSFEVGLWMNGPVPQRPGDALMFGLLWNAAAELSAIISFRINGTL